MNQSFALKTYLPCQLTQEEERQLERLYRSALVKQRQCLYPGCTEVAITSHILQKKGVLDKIAEQGHVMQLAPHKPFYPTRFEKKGIGVADMLTFNGFCAVNKHDNTIFKEIENSSCDYSTYRQQLLAGYRAHLNELSKQYVLVDFHEGIFQNSILRPEIKESYKTAYCEMLWQIKDSEHFKLLIEKELFISENKQFTFHRFELPKVEVATSAITGFSAYIMEMPVDEVKAYDYNDLVSTMQLSKVFVNLIPSDKSLIFVLGYNNSTQHIDNLPISEIDNLSEKQVFKLISNLLVKYLETWCISVSLYNRLDFQDKIDIILNIKTACSDNPNRKSSSIGFDMFEAIL